MDFFFTSEADEAAGLAAKILGDKTLTDRMTEVENAGDRFDADLWRDLAEAGLVGLAVPEEYGGAGLGLIELGRVLVEIGRTVAPVPLAVTAPCAILLSELADEETKAELLTGIAAGEARLTAAVSEERAHLPQHPTVEARGDANSGYTLHGSKALVRAGTRATHFLVTATTTDGVGVFLLPADAVDTETVVQRTSDRDAVVRLDLQGASATLLGAADGEAAARLGQLLIVCGAAEQLGITEGALHLTAAYSKTREQFGRPIGTFQAVSQRLADGYIDVLGQRLTLWQAIWRLSEWLPAETEVATAKLWAADAGHRIAHTTVHVHGGVGIDMDGEAHRYFTSAKRFEFSYGSATDQALTIGKVLASEPA